MHTDTDFATVEVLLRDRFGGVLMDGSHAPNGQACVLELAHMACGDPWSDTPDRWPDLRPLNDAPWSSDALRTTQMLRVLAAYWDWSEWSVSRRQRCIEYLAIETVRQLIAPLPGLSAAARIACQDAQTYRDAEAAAAEAAAERAAAAAAALRTAADAALTATDAALAAAEAAWAARAAAAAAAEAAAWDAARAARGAARAARSAARAAAMESDLVLVTACSLWIEAAQASMQK